MADAPSRMDAAPATSHHLLDASAFWGPAGGVRRVLTARHEVLPRLGWRHTVLAPRARGPGFIDCGGLPVPWSGGYRLPWWQRRVVQLIEAAQPDLIEAADPYTVAWAVLEAGRRLHVPTVAFCHSNLPAMAERLVGGALGAVRGRWAAARAQAYLTDLYARFDLVLAPSRSMVQRLRQWGLKDAQWQPLGVDCQTFNPSAADALWRQQLIQRLGVPSSTRLLLYTGRFAPEKHLGLLADAVGLLGPGHLLVAVGSGPRPPRGAQVRVLPPVTDSGLLARLLANCDIYVHAGDQETFGLGALEAMASGLPTVLSDCDGLGELAQAGGLAVKSRQPSDWAKAMASALSERRDELRDQALAHARAHDWQPIVAQMVHRYGRVLQHSAQRREAGSAASPPL
ncbi:MAG TPA: glycosyltransferase [Burkholderiaceae bacterium]|nr:glycosyltransferase [Burkholderiaceae bacterium]